MRFKTIGSISFQTLYNCKALSLFAGLRLVAILRAEEEISPSRKFEMGSLFYDH
jgi:hypothetical protein